MKSRFALRLGGLGAAIACAVLAACGGGGGSSTPFVTPTSTPVPTATPTTAPTAQATSAPLSTSATTPISLGGVSSGGVNKISAATLTLPIVSAATNAGVSLTATAPSGVPTPSARSMRLKRPDTLGVPSTPLAYFAVTFTNSVTISASPAFSVTFPAAVSGNCYVVVYDPTSVLGTGWLQVSGPVVGSGPTLTFPSATQSPPIALTGGVTYVFAIVTTSSVIPTPTPTPTASPTASPSPSPSPTGSATSSPTASPSLGPVIQPTTNAAGFTPSEVANQFAFPVQSGYNGTGQTIVVLGNYSAITSDLNAYLSYYHITSAGANFSVVPINSFVAPGTVSGQGEATLDMETVASLAPGATIEFYALKDLSGSSFLSAYTQLASDTHATIMTASFGGCEYANFTDTMEHPMLAQAAAHGVVMFASSGDQGSQCYYGSSGGNPIYSPGPNAPASDPDVVGVGGQENFTSPGVCPGLPGGSPTLSSTVGWHDCFFSSGEGATGGGVSALFTPRPSYQTSGSSSTARNIPDLSMPSENFAIYLNGAFGGFGGTSWSAPLMAAMTAGINQYCGGSMVTPAATNPVGRFYTAYTRNPAAFLDITTGNNQFMGSTLTYSAGTGYDNTTGLGIPNGMQVAAALCPSHVPNAKAFAVTHSVQAVPIDQYGEARETAMQYVPRVAGTVDMGDRGTAPVDIALVMRATPTVASDEQGVIATLRAAGFTITQTYANHLLINATAPADTVARFFQTTIRNVSQGQYGLRYANASPVILPASIARVAHGVLVDNLIIAHHMHHQTSPADPLAELLQP